VVRQPRPRLGYVTYRNTLSKHTLVLGISNVALSQGDAQVAYTLRYR